nr:MerR family transcriptional regulator [Desertimonas flava]
MAEPTVAHLSIGEVLGLLLEEFPDVTISKIRFLESQGLIEPERTPSGYRKFYDADVELLRIILREQREHFLPLRVIKDRIDSGEIEPPSEVVAKHPAAGGRIAAGTSAPSRSASHPVTSRPTEPASRPRADQQAAPSPRPSAPTARPPAPATPVSRGSSSATMDLSPTPADMPRPAAATQPAAPRQQSPRLLPGVLVNRDELCSMASVTPAQLHQLEEYGVVSRRKGSGDLYGEDAVEITAAAGSLLRAGIDARHLRAWRTSVEREVGLFEQLVVPLLRQRNPEARVQASAQLEELGALAAKLRAALTRAATRNSLNL